MNNDDWLKIILASDADQIIKLLVAKNTADERVEIEIREESGINAE